MANDDFSEPPRHADSKNPIFFFSRFLGLGHLQGLGVRLGRILGVLSIEPFLGEGGVPAGGLYRTPPPPPRNENPASQGAAPLRIYLTLPWLQSLRLPSNPCSMRFSTGPLPVDSPVQPVDGVVIDIVLKCPMPNALRSRRSGWTRDPHAQVSWRGAAWGLLVAFPSLPIFPARLPVLPSWLTIFCDSIRKGMALCSASCGHNSSISAPEAQSHALGAMKDMQHSSANS